MKWLTAFVIVLTVMGFASCGGAKTTYKKKSATSLLTTKNASQVLPSGEMIGTYQSFSDDSVFSYIEFKSDGKVIVTANGSNSIESLGKDAAGKFYITDTARGVVYLISSDSNALYLYRTDLEERSQSITDVFYKM